jgi:hypothetical protein
VMAENILQKVLERAFSDQPFRVRLEADLDEALDREGYKLSSDERRQLKGILDEGRETFATGLDQRLSQSGVSLSPQGLLRQKSKAADHGSGLLRQEGQAENKSRQHRPGPAGNNSAVGKKHPEDRHREAIDDREPDYEVETD